MLRIMVYQLLFGIFFRSRRALRSGTIDLYNRIEEGKKKKPPRPISITLTPATTTESTVLLSIASQFPIPTESLSLQTRPRSISFSGHVDIIEVPSSDGTEDECEEQL